jgi:hypothetical protein
LSPAPEWVEANGLALHPDKAKIVDARVESFDFLGYRFRGKLRLRGRRACASSRRIAPNSAPVRRGRGQSSPMAAPPPPHAQSEAMGVDCRAALCAPIEAL